MSNSKKRRRSNQVTKSELEALRKAPRRSNVVTRGTLEKQRKEWKEKGYKIEPYQTYELRKHNGEVIGTVGEGGKSAIENGTLNDYTPANEEEKKTLELYNNYINSPYDDTEQYGYTLEEGHKKENELGVQVEGIYNWRAHEDISYDENYELALRYRRDVLGETLSDEEERLINQKYSHSLHDNPRDYRLAEHAYKKFDFDKYYKDQSVINDYNQIKEENEIREQERENVQFYKTGTRVNKDESGNVDYNLGYTESKSNKERAERRQTLGRVSMAERQRVGFGEGTEEENKRVSKFYGYGDTAGLEYSKMEAYNYYGKNHENVYANNIGGRISGNYKLGRIGTKTNEAGYTAYGVGTDDLEAVEVYQLLSGKIYQNNIDTFTNNNGFDEFVATTAQYAPQAVDQFAVALPGRVIGLFGGPAGKVIGSGVANAAQAGYMFRQTAGASFIRNIQENGLSVSDAKKLAQNEGLVSEAIEFGVGFGFDFVGSRLVKSAGASKIQKGLYKGLTKAGVSEKGANIIIKSAKKAGEFAYNSVSEGAEEWLQEGVAITADKMAKEGKTPGIFELAWKSFDIDSYSNEELDRMSDAAKGSFLIGLGRVGLSGISGISGNSTKRVIGSVKNNKDLGNAVLSMDNSEDILLNAIDYGRNSGNTNIKKAAEELDALLLTEEKVSASKVGKYIKQVSKDGYDIYGFMSKGAKRETSVQENNIVETKNSETEKTGKYDGDELSEIINSDGVKMYAPFDSNATIKNLENKLIEQGVTGESRQSIVSSASLIQSITGSEEITDAVIKSVVSDTGFILNEFKKIGSMPGYWNVFKQSMAFAANPEISIDSEYIKNYTALFSALLEKNSSSNVYRVLSENGNNVFDVLYNYITTGAIPENISNVEALKLAGNSLKNIIKTAAGLNIKTYKLAYGENVFLNEQLRKIESGDFSAVRENNKTENTGKITVGMSDDARAELLNKKSINVVRFNATKAKIFENVDFDVLQNSYPSYARPIIKKIARDFGIFQESYFNPDIELEFNYSGDSIQESINKQHSKYGDFVKMLSVFSDIIENAVGIETHKDKYTGTRREDTNLKQMYVLASAFSDEKGVNPVKLEVKEFKKNTNKLYLSVVLTKKESRDHSGNLGQNQLNTAPPTSVISIADLVGIVNPSEGDFLKYFPDSMLDSEQIESKNKALDKDTEKVKKLSQKSKTRTDNIADESDAEVSEIVDAVEETLIPGAKEKLLDALEKGGHRADIITLAKALRKAYKNTGTISKMANFFKDKGDKVISAIESTIDATETEIVADDRLSLTEKSNEITHKDNEEVLQNKDKNDIMAEKGVNTDVYSGRNQTENQKERTDNNGRTLLENDNGFSKTSSERETDTIPKSRNSIYTEKSGATQFAERGYTEVERRTVENRAIDDILENKDFIKVKHIVRTELSSTVHNDLYEKYKYDDRIIQGYDFDEVYTYDMLSDENNELRELFADNIAEYFNKDIGVMQDITGQKVSEDILKATKKSVVKNEHGQLIPVYHGTNADFTEFKIGDVGFHFGSYAQALKLIKDKGYTTPKMKRAYLNIENPLIIDDDRGGWNASQIAQIMVERGILSREEGLSFVDLGINEADNKRMVEILREHNYDGIIYTNSYEADEGTAYIVFDDNQVLVTETMEIPKDEMTFRYSVDNYAPTFYSHMSKTIDEMKDGKYGANSVVSYLKGRGVKDEEIKWSGIETFLEGKKSVTKAELQEFVANNQLQIEETVLDGSQSITLERQEEGSNDYYVMRGGEIYDSLTYDSSSVSWVSDAYGFYFNSMPSIRNYYGVGEGGTHWGKYKLDGGENYREITFKMPNSDYTNQAMKAHWGENAKGILAHARVQDMTTDDGKKMLFIEEIQSDWHNEGQKKGYIKGNEADIRAKRDELANYIKSRLGKDNSAEEIAKIQEARAEYIQLGQDMSRADAIPDAPFRNNYHEYVLKNLIRMAAEQGYDSIGWTPSNIQSERWSEDYAEGYRIEYDQDIPKFLNKYGKKWGTKVEKTEIGQVDGGWYEVEGTKVWSMPITESMKNSVLYEGQTLYSLEKRGNNNDRRGSNSISDNSRGERDGSSRKQTGRFSSFEQKNKGKKRTERKRITEEIRAKGQTESEVVKGKYKFEVIKPEAYNDDMKAMIEDAKSRGVEIVFFTGAGILGFDSKRTTKINGLKVSNSKIYVQYDAIVSPQKIAKHESCHAKWKTSEMQNVKDTILNSLSESDKEKILSSDRYSDYMDLYKNHKNQKDIVWEEFVADTLSGMNEYTERFIDTVNDYWYGDEVVDNYSPAEYNNIMDAGGMNAEKRKNNDVIDDMGYGNEYKLSESGENYGYEQNSDSGKLGRNENPVKTKRFNRVGEMGYVQSEKSDTPHTKRVHRSGVSAETITSSDLTADHALPKGSMINEYHKDLSKFEWWKYYQHVNNYDWDAELRKSKFDFYMIIGDKLIKSNYSKGKPTVLKIYTINDIEILPYKEGIIYDNDTREILAELTKTTKSLHKGTDDNFREPIKRQRKGNGRVVDIDGKQLDTTANHELSEQESSNIDDERYSLEGDDIPDFLELWDNYVDEYDAIPKGENPARDIDVPKKVSKDKFVSRFARTMLEAGITPDYIVSDFEKSILDGEMTHEVITDVDAAEYAKNEIKYHGFDEMLDRWYSWSKSGKIDKKELAIGMELYNQCVTNKDTVNALKLAAELAAEATKAGQTLQACRMLKKMSPDGQLYYLEKSIQKMNDEFREQIGEKYKDIEIPEELMERFLNESDEDKRNAIYDEICQNIADQIPATKKDKWDSWRYLSMLGNLRTHIRNITGNAVFLPAIRLKNYVGALIEKGMKIDKSERTHSIKKSEEAIAFAEKDFMEMESALQGENAKYAVTSDIEGKRTIFKTKWLEKARLKNFDFLEMEDMWFLKAHYVDALARLITVRGLDINNLSVKTLETIRALAVKEAQAATYRDANSLAEALNKVQRKWGRSKKAIVRGAGMLVEGVMPFKKTPLNIAKQGINYSPAGLLKGIYKTASKMKKGKAFSTAEIIDDFAKGLTGTMMMLLGTMLASLGIISGNDDEEKKKRKFDKMVGEQAFSLNIGGFSYTIDWMTPSCLPLFTGVELFELAKDGFDFGDITDALSTLTEPMLELSVLSGISSAIESAQYNETNTFFAIGSDMLTSYILQAVPTFGGQISRIIDKNKREYYYVDKNSSLPKGLQTFIGQAASKIPFASFLFEPSVDEWGREQTYGSLGERIFENFISPGYYSNENYTDVDKELLRLYEATGDNSVLPTTQQKYYKEDGIAYHMSAADYTEVKKIRGQKSFELINELINSDGYKRMSDEEKAKAIAKRYEEAGKYAKGKMLEKVKQNSRK